MLWELTWIVFKFCINFIVMKEQTKYMKWQHFILSWRNKKFLVHVFNFVFDTKEENKIMETFVLLS